VDKTVIRKDVYCLLADPSLAIRHAASDLVACLLIDEAEQKAKVRTSGFRVVILEIITKLVLIKCE
jgi:hypothetical protein